MKIFRKNTLLSIEPYLYLFPALIGIVLATGGAIVASFLLGFTKWDLIGSPEWIGIDNFAKMLNSELFWQVFGNTFWYVVLFVPLSMIGSLLLALLVNRKLRGMNIFRTIYFLPVVSSMVAIALIWSWLYNPEFGLINYLLDVIANIDGPRWLLSTDWAMPAIAILSAWKTFGYNMLILLAGLQTVPSILHEAAMLDGAGPIRRFWNVTLPALSPTLFFVLIITLIGSFQLFEQTYVMTQGGPANSTLTLSYYAYQNAFQFFRMGYGAAIACVLFVITLIVAALQFRLQKHWVFYGQ